MILFFFLFMAITSISLYSEQTQNNTHSSSRLIFSRTTDSTLFSISGSVYRDLDSIAETPDDWVDEANWTMLLLDTMNNVLKTTRTDTLGDFSFDTLSPGIYRVREESINGWKPIGIELGIPVQTVTQLDSVTIQVTLDSLYRYSFGNNFINFKAPEPVSFTGGGGNNNFLNPLNWSNGTVPKSFHKAVINNGDNVVIETFIPKTVSGNVLLTSPLKIGGLVVNGTLTVKTDIPIQIGVGNVTISGNLIIDTNYQPRITVDGDFLITTSGKSTGGEFSPGKSTVQFTSNRMQRVSETSFYKLGIEASFSEQSGYLVTDGDITVEDSIGIADTIDAKGDSIIIENTNTDALTFDDESVVILRGTVVRAVGSSSKNATALRYEFESQNSFIEFPVAKNNALPQQVTVTTFPDSLPPNLPDQYIAYRFYDIDANGGNSYNATLQLRYNAEELPEGVDAEDVRLMKSEDGVNFVNVGGISDPLNNTVLLTGVNDFSRWSFGQVGHKSGDTTRFTTVRQESLNVVAVKMKKKKGKPTPVPLQANVRDAAFKSQIVKPGMIIGVPILDKKLLKTRGYLIISKGAALIKFLPQFGFAQTFSSDLLKGKPFVGKVKDPKLEKYNDGDGNSLVAELITLRTNIAASKGGITPPYGQAGYPTFGDIVFDEEDNPCSGFSLEDICKMADTMLTYDTLARTTRNDYDPDILLDCIQRVNNEFSGKISLYDTNILDPLKVNAIRPINQVTFVKRPSKMNSSVQNFLQQKPKSFLLEQNYPNPFNPSTALSFQLSAISEVDLKVYDVLGREVATLLNSEQLDEGEHEVQFDASKLSSGVYFYRISVTQDGILRNTETRKMLLMK